MKPTLIGVVLSAGTLWGSAALAQACDTTSEIDRGRCRTYEAIRSGEARSCADLESELDRETCYSAVARRTGEQPCGDIDNQFGSFACRRHGEAGADEARLREQARQAAAEERLIEEQHLAEQQAVLEVLEAQLAAQEQIRLDLEAERALAAERRLEEERGAPAEPAE
jgi:hypothetical protein